MIDSEGHKNYKIAKNSGLLPENIYDQESDEGPRVSHVSLREEYKEERMIDVKDKIPKEKQEEAKLKNDRSMALWQNMCEQWRYIHGSEYPATKEGIDNAYNEDPPEAPHKEEVAMMIVHIAM